jgi:hypothetical protein
LPVPLPSVPQRSPQTSHLPVVVMAVMVVMVVTVVTVGTASTAAAISMVGSAAAASTVAPHTTAATTAGGGMAGRGFGSAEPARCSACFRRQIHCDGHDDSLSDGAGCSFDISPLNVPRKIGRIGHDRNQLSGGNKFAQQFEPLWPQRIGEQSDAGDIAARPVEAGDEAFLNRIAAAQGHDRDGRSRGLSGRPRAPSSDNDVDPTTHELVR